MRVKYPILRYELKLQDVHHYQLQQEVHDQHIYLQKYLEINEKVLDQGYTRDEDVVNFDN